jgi:hypothetical protein
MKTIIPFILLVLLAQLSALSNTPFKGDTIWYKFDNMLVEVVSTDFKATSPETSKVVESMVKMKRVLEQLTITEPAQDEQVMITFRDLSDKVRVWNYRDIELTREKKSSKNLMVFDDGTIFEKDFGRYCVSIICNDWEIRYYINELSVLDEIESENFSTKAGQGTQSVSAKVGSLYRKTPIQAWVDLRKEQPEVFIQNSGYKPNDMLLISGGIGSGWVKNTFVSDLNFRFGLGFARHGMMKNIYSLDWSMMYDFSNSNDDRYFELNHFMSLSWEHNFSNSPLDEKWYGFSFGYLIKRNNDFFKENTFRFSVNKKINNTFSVKPELYFNDFFKNIYPGIRIAVAF